MISQVIFSVINKVSKLIIGTQEVKLYSIDFQIVVVSSLWMCFVVDEQEYDEMSVFESTECKVVLC